MILPYEEKRWNQSFIEQIKSGKKKIKIPDKVGESIKEDILIKIRQYALMMHNWRQESSRNDKIFFGNRNCQ